MLRQAKHYQEQSKKKDTEMAVLKSKLEKGVLTAKDFELESLRIAQAYPLAQSSSK